MRSFIGKIRGPLGWFSLAVFLASPAATGAVMNGGGIFGIGSGCGSVVSCTHVGPGLSLAIPDNDPGGVTSTLTVTDFGIIDQLAVVVSMSHTWVGDLVLTLTGPSGTSVVLADRPGVPASTVGDSANLAANYPIRFLDRAGVPAENMGAACGSTNDIIRRDCAVFGFIPEEALSAFAGQSVSGDWTLFVSDNFAEDTGAINGWLLIADVNGGLVATIPVPPALWLFGSALIGLLRMRAR